MSPSYWMSASGPEIYQGDWLPACRVPLIQSDFGGVDGDVTLQSGRIGLIVMSQSCDLVSGKSAAVALCPIMTIPAYEAINPAMTKKGVWEDVRKARREGMHLLASPTNPTVARESLVVSFREIYSLPLSYLSAHASSLLSRWRLQSPFLEHFSQAFARFFMRVGLPSAVPPFTD